MALKNSVSPIVVRELGLEPELPARMSATGTVPSGVPSDFQSSRPLLPSSATKNRVFPTAARELGLEQIHPG
jgi:hypothetical protein